MGSSRLNRRLGFIDPWEMWRFNAFLWSLSFQNTLFDFKLHNSQNAHSVKNNKLKWWKIFFSFSIAYSQTLIFISKNSQLFRPMPADSLLYIRSWLDFFHCRGQCFAEIWNIWPRAKSKIGTQIFFATLTIFRRRKINFDFGKILLSSFELSYCVLKFWNVSFVVV